jgi:hypothetical protein
MKIRDIFLPKIARSDPEVRKQAVLNEENAELLKKVSEKDDDPEVRKLARQRLEKVTDQVTA